MPGRSLCSVGILLGRQLPTMAGASANSVRPLFFVPFSSPGGVNTSRVLNVTALMLKTLWNKGLGRAQVAKLSRRTLISAFGNMNQSEAFSIVDGVLSYNYLIYNRTDCLTLLASELTPNTATFSRVLVSVPSRVLVSVPTEDQHLHTTSRRTLVSVPRLCTSSLIRKGLASSVSFRSKTRGGMTKIGNLSLCA